MTTITSTKRGINILNKAIDNGFIIETTSHQFDRILQNAKCYLMNGEYDVIEEECQVKSLGSHGQRVDHSDGFGFDFWAQGEIIDFSRYWHLSPDTKIYHEQYINSLGQLVKLYFTLGENDYNKDRN